MASQRTAANAEVTTGLIVKASKAGTSTRCANEAQDTIREETASKANVTISNPPEAGCHRGPRCHSTFSQGHSEGTR